MTSTKYHDLLLAAGMAFTAQIDTIGAQADAEIASLQPQPPASGFFSGLSYSTQFSRSWTLAQMQAIKAKGFQVIGITDDYWTAGAAQRDPHTTQAYAMAKLAISVGLRVYIRLWCPGSSLGQQSIAFPSWWVSYCTAWAQAIDHDFGAANAALNFQNEPGQANWHDIFTQCYNAARAIDKSLVIGYTPKITALADGHWDWFPDYQNWAPPADVWLDFHSYGEGGQGSNFMNQGVASWAPAAKTVPWQASYAATFQTSWKRFTDLAKTRGQAGVINGECGASIVPAPTTQDNINCTTDLWNVAKGLGMASLFLFNNRPGTDYQTEDGNGNLLPWVKSLVLT